jgi:hypothetical protein
LKQVIPVHVSDSEQTRGSTSFDVAGLGGSGVAEKSVFIVQCKPRKPEGILKITTETRKAALEAANDFLNQGMPFVTVVADGRVYTVEEFAMTIINRGA